LGRNTPGHCGPGAIYEREKSDPQEAKDIMPRTLGIFLTWTTYGTWLRGDRRGWVERGLVYPPDPVLEEADRRRLRYPPFLLPRRQRHRAGELIGQSADRLGAKVHALFVGAWHVHLVTGYVHVPLPEVVKVLKEGVRNGLGYSRAIWVDGYDKRFCFDAGSLRARVEYVCKHNVEDGLAPDPWGFIEPVRWR